MENPFEFLDQRLARLESLMNQLLTQLPKPGPEIERPIFIKEAAAILNLSTSAVYKSIQSIPHTKRHGQYYFFESKLLAYLAEDELSSVVKTIEVHRHTRRKTTASENI